MQQARFGILGANVRYTDGRDVEWIRNDTIVTRGRTRIGIIGLSTVMTGGLALATHVAGMRFDDPAPIVDSIGTALRKRGAQFIVVIAHAGAFCSRDGKTSCDGEIIDLAQKVTTKVDAIVSGHTHSLVNTVVKGIPIVQGRSSGRAIDLVDIPLDRARKLASRQQVRELSADTLQPLPPIDSIVQRAAARVAPLMNQRIATIPTDLPRRGKQYPLGNLVADAQRWAGKGDVAIMNNGGIRTGLWAGEVNYGALFEVQPFGNTLYSVSITGGRLRELLEVMLAEGEPDDHVSGLMVKYDSSRPKGSRIVSATTANGEPLSDVKTYSVIVNNFVLHRGEGYDLESRAVSSTPLSIIDLDALIQYLQQLPTPVMAPTEVRIAPVAK